MYGYHNEGASQDTLTNTGIQPTMSVVQLDTAGNATTLQGADVGRDSHNDGRNIQLLLPIPPQIDNRNNASWYCSRLSESMMMVRLQTPQHL